MEPASRLRIGGNILGTGSLSRSGWSLNRSRVRMDRPRVNRVLSYAGARMRGAGGRPGYRSIPARQRGYFRSGGAYRGSRSMRKELKNWDVLGTLNLTASNAFQVSSGANTGAVFVGIAQGTTQNTRTGRKIRVKSLHIKGDVIFTPGTGTIGSDTLVVYVVHDKQANGAYPTSVADFLNNGGAGAVNNEFHNLDNSHRYKVLAKYVEKFESAAGVSGAYDPVDRACDWYIPLNMEVMMNSTAGAITEIRDNNIVMFWGSANGLCSINGSTRVRFYDQA